MEECMTLKNEDCINTLCSVCLMHRDKNIVIPTKFRGEVLVCYDCLENSILDSQYERKK